MNTTQCYKYSKHNHFKTRLFDQIFFAIIFILCKVKETYELLILIVVMATRLQPFFSFRRDFRVIVARTPNTTEVIPQVTTYSDIGVGRVVGIPPYIAMVRDCLTQSILGQVREKYHKSNESRFS